MRDRTASRSYSPAGEQFRREHERHRSWGLTRRHAERLRRSRSNDPRTPTATGNHPESRAHTPPLHSVSPTSTPPDRTKRPTASPEFPASQNRSGGGKNTTDQPGPPGNRSSEPAGKASRRPVGKASARPARNASSRVAGKAASRPAGKAASRPAGKAASRPAGKAASRPAGMAASRSAGQRRSGPARQRPTALRGTRRSGPTQIRRHGPARNAKPDPPETNNHPLNTDLPGVLPDHDGQPAGRGRGGRRRPRGHPPRRCAGRQARGQRVLSDRALGRVQHGGLAGGHVGGELVVEDVRTDGEFVAAGRHRVCGQRRAESAPGNFPDRSKADSPCSGAKAQT